MDLNDHITIININILFLSTAMQFICTLQCLHLIKYLCYLVLDNVQCTLNQSAISIKTNTYTQQTSM